MGSLVRLGIASLLLLAAWAAPAEEETSQAEKPKADLAIYENTDLDNYDLTLDSYGEIVDLSNYEELYDYGDLAPKIEVGTLAPPTKAQEGLPNLGTTAETPELQPPSTAAATAGSGHPGLPGPITAEGDPPLPREPAYLYARFNRIGEIRAGDFVGMSMSRPAFVGLDARLNRIPSAGVRPEAFRDLTQLQFLHLSDNELDYIPAPLPQSLRSLHLQQEPQKALVQPQQLLCKWPWVSKGRDFRVSPLVPGLGPLPGEPW
nr:PREDICTED: opticin [Struthio camelus australis]